MEVLRTGSAKVGNVRQVTLSLRALASRTEPITTQRFKTAAVQTSGTTAGKQFPLPGNVTSQIAYSAIQEVPRVEIPVQDQVIAMECPDVILKKAQELFPKQKLEKASIVNFIRKTEADMSEWSPKMEVEWTGLTTDFTQKALQTCEILRSLGYWADFVDPSTGKAFLSESKSDVALNGTDEEYRSLGFDVIDMGCCKVLSHPLFGKHVFVGTLFTDASTEVLSHI